MLGYRYLTGVSTLTYHKERCIGLWNLCTGLSAPNSCAGGATGGDSRCGSLHRVWSLRTELPC